MTLTQEQSNALNAIIDFINSGCSIFILKGYAGTGKTTLLKRLLEELPAIAPDRPFRLFAPTGRAAKILNDKTGTGSTIHKGIYKKADEVITYKEDENLNLTIDTNADNNKLIFKIDLNLSRCRPIVIIDESSMISSKAVPDDRFQFGTDNLLDDLLTFSGVSDGGQVIFIGDDAQLPPVNDSDSVALTVEYFANRRLPVRTATLKQVMRQGEGSVILENAMSVRDNIFKDRKDRFGSNYRRVDGEFSDITPSEAIIETVRNFEKTIVITYANATAAKYNAAIRNIRFPGHKEPVPGDRLLVVRNAYNIGNVESEDFSMFNGEFCDIIDVGEEELKYAFVGPNRIELRFRDVKIRHESGTILRLKIISNLLDSTAPNLTADESKALFSEFTSRHRTLLKKQFRDQFLVALHHDPYFNAIQVKYGYAITCHKAQGGEWDNVIVDFNGRSGLNTESLRWTYTALTRAKKHLMLTNFARTTPLFKMTIHPIARSKSMDAECHANEDADIPTSTPFHAATALECKRAKFAAVTKLLLPSEEIINVISKEWQEIYNIKIGDKIFRYDTTHNKKGIFGSFNLITIPPTAEATDLLLRLNTTPKPESRYSYIAASTALEYLDEIVKECAAQANLMITNVVDHPTQSFVNYYFFSTTYHKVQFYYKDKGDISTAMPSTLGDPSPCKEFQSFLQMLIDSK